jgi:hypothetical protein
MRNTEKQGGKAVLKFSAHKRKRYDDAGDDVDALFRLPLAEFTGARNALAARLKKNGHGDESALVKALAKPPISAWAVNQLYWNHREAFDRLIASGERFHKAQTSRSAGKAADMREALEARREALTHLTDLATSLLNDEGNNPSLDTVRRITTTLEGISAYASRSDGPPPGRLTYDVDPPGFESLSSFVPGMRSVSRSVGIAGVSKSAKRKQMYPPSTPGATDLTTTNTQRKVKPDADLRQLEETRKAKIAAAKVSLQNAKKTLTEARARAQSLEAAQKKADAEEKKAEKHRRDAEENLEKAKTASEDAAQRAQSVTVEVGEAASAVKDAERTVEATSKELESLVRESS